MKIRGNTVGTTMSPDKVGERNGAVLYTPQTLTEEQQAQARDNIYAPSTADFDDLSLVVSQYRNDLEEADYQLGQRVNELESGFRHIATINCEEDIKQIDITQDSEGNAFACSEFVIIATSAPLADNKPHLYIGSPAWTWLVADSGFFSTTATQKFRMHLKHICGGQWVYDSVRSTFNDDAASADTRGNIRSMNQFGEKLSLISFWAHGTIPAGSSFEVYGK